MPVPTPVAAAIVPSTPAPVRTSPASPAASQPATPPASQPAARPRTSSCPYLDILTAHAGYGDWQRTLLDTTYRLPATYAPGDLVSTSAAGLNGGYVVRSIVIGDLKAMASAARAAGNPIGVVSGYRSYTKQQATFQHWVDVGGYQDALRTSARPGHSEHQLGTVVDVSTAGGRAPWDYGDWAKTPAGAWIAKNSWRYGFVVSYPRGAFSRTCYDYEPWHLRYFGRARAAAIVGSGLTARQYLLRHQ